MGKILDHLGINYTIGIDEAAFTVLSDFQIKNVHGKEDTLITIQIDMLLAQKFGMEYIDVDVQEKHRTLSTDPLLAVMKNSCPAY